MKRFLLYLVLEAELHRRLLEESGVLIEDDRQREGIAMKKDDTAQDRSGLKEKADLTYYVL